MPLLIGELIVLRLLLLSKERFKVAVLRALGDLSSLGSLLR